MKRNRPPRTLLLICILSCSFLANALHTTKLISSCQVYFSPHGGATSAIATTLNNAKSTVLVQAYSFTSKPIAEALVSPRTQRQRAGPPRQEPEDSEIRRH